MKRQFFVYPPVMVLALFTASLGYLIPQIQEAYSISYSAAGLFSTLQSVGTTLAIVLCFCVFSGLNKSRLILVGSLALALFILLLSANLALFMVYAVFFFVGLAMTVPDSLVHAELADLSGSRSTFYISLLHALWALVGVFAPFFTMFIHSSYRTVFMLISLMIAACALLFWLGMRKYIKRSFVEDRSKMGSLKKFVRIIKIPGMALFFVTTLLCCFVQTPLIYFIRIYSQDVTGSELYGAIALSSLYIGLFAGGLVNAVISHKVEPFKLMIVSNSLSLFFMGAMLVFSNIVAISIFTMLATFFMAPSVPILFAKACENSCDDSAAATALVYLGVALSAMIAPPLIGAIGDAIGLRFAFLANASVYIIVIALSVLLYKLNGKDKLCVNKA